MLIKPDERRPLADLLGFLEMGERLAHDCAHAQAVIAPDPRMSQFLRGQANQEAFHASLFQGAAKLIAPGRQKQYDTYPPLQHYRDLIMHALDRRDFLETILAEQVILESLGEAILHKLEAGLKKRNAPFNRLRHLLLHQEAAHHGFGERVLDQAITEGKTSHAFLREKARPYLALSQSLILDLQARLEDIDENPHDYIQGHHALLPEWLVDPAEEPMLRGVPVDSLAQAPTLHLTHPHRYLLRKSRGYSGHSVYAGMTQE